MYVSNKRSDYLTKEETNTSLTAIAIEVSPMKKVKEMKVTGYSGHTSIKRPVREKAGSVQTRGRQCFSLVWSLTFGKGEKSGQTRRRPEELSE